MNDKPSSQPRPTSTTANPIGPRADALDTVNDRPANTEAQALRPPKPGLWLVYLFLRPARFYPHYVVDAAPLLTAFALMAMGVAEALTQVAFGQSPGFTRHFADDWVACWIMMGAAGLIGAVVFYAVGGWWYRERLRLCGAYDVDPWLPRRAYIYSTLVVTLPTLAWVVWKMLGGVSPEAALTLTLDDAPIVTALFVLNAWSCCISYAGAMAIFKLKRAAARFWLLALPMSYYVLGLVVIVAQVLVDRERASDLEHPNRFERPGLVLQYPGNWTSRDESNPDEQLYGVTLDDPRGDGNVQVFVFCTTLTPKEELANTVTVFREQGPWEDGVRISQIGPFRGVGRRGRANWDGVDYDVRILVSLIDHERVLELRVVHTGVVSYRFDEAVDFIINSIDVSPQAERD